jgi:hypothetical protein
MNNDKQSADPVASFTRFFASFYRLEEAATFFLHDAFEHAYLAAQLEVAGLIFGERIMSIDPEPDWKVPPLPTTLPDLLRSEVQVISDATASRLAQAWEEAQITASSSGRRLAKTHAIESIEIVGHIINLSACVESVINRHLFFLRESEKLAAHHYASLDRTETIPKILFAFKDEILSKQFSTSRLKHLFRLRNQAVHFKASSARSIRPTVEELLGIWREVAQLLELVEGEPTQQQINELADAVASKWFA